MKDLEIRVDNLEKSFRKMCRLVCVFVWIVYFLVCYLLATNPGEYTWLCNRTSNLVRIHSKL